MVTAKCSPCASQCAVLKLIRQQKTMHCSALCVLQQRVWVLSYLPAFIFALLIFKASKLFLQSGFLH